MYFYAICHLVTVLFVRGHQLITAFEKAMVLMDPVPGEEHKKVSADYVKCLSKVSAPYLMSVSPPHNCKNKVFMFIKDNRKVDTSYLALYNNFLNQLLLMNLVLP